LEEEGAQERNVSQVSRYYDSVQWVYNLGHFVYNLATTEAGRAHSIHYGVWLKDTKGMVDALLNVDRLAAQGLDLASQDIVLDAGCGVGGTSVFFASTFGCRVVGVTVSDVQLRQARANAGKAGMGHLVSFMKMDYTRMRFEDGTFSKVVGIESICYADNKRKFVEEAFRVLKEGGRLVVTDAFLRRPPISEKEKRDLETFYRGWKVPYLESAQEFRAHLDSAGFSVTRFKDLTGGTIPTAKIIYGMHLPLYPIALLMSRFKNPSSQELLGHVKASMSQIRLGPCNKNGIISYGMFVAEKGRGEEGRKVGRELGSSSSAGSS
jgi:tocopherol O-methyltransferase